MVGGTASVVGTWWASVRPHPMQTTITSTGISAARDLNRSSIAPVFRIRLG